MIMIWPARSDRFKPTVDSGAVGLKRSDLRSRLGFAISLSPSKIFQSATVWRTQTSSSSEIFRSATVWRTESSKHCVFDPSGRGQFYLHFNLGSDFRTATERTPASMENHDFSLQYKNFSGSPLMWRTGKFNLDAGVQFRKNLDAGVQTKLFSSGSP